MNVRRRYARYYTSITLPWTYSLTVNQEETNYVLDLGSRLRAAMSDSSFVKAWQQFRVSNITILFQPSCNEGTWPVPLKAVFNNVVGSGGPAIDPLKTSALYIKPSAMTRLRFKVRGQNNEMGVWQDINKDSELSARLVMATLIAQDSDTRIASYQVTVQYKIQLRYPVNTLEDLGLERKKAEVIVNMDDVKREVEQKKELKTSVCVYDEFLRFKNHLKEAKDSK